MFQSFFALISRTCRLCVDLKATFTGSEAFIYAVLIRTASNSMYAAQEFSNGLKGDVL